MSLINSLKSDRQFAYLTDSFFLGIIFWLIGVIFNFNFKASETTLTSFGSFIFWLLWFLYFCVIQYKFGTTLGKYMFDLKVIDKRTNVKPSFLRLFTREILFLTLFPTLGIILLFKGYYWDKITKTDVIQTKEKELNLNSIINFIKSQKILFLIIISAIAIGLWFYWFQLRPAQIRKECAEKYKYQNEIFYEQCVRSKGLEK